MRVAYFEKFRSLKKEQDAGAIMLQFPQWVIINLLRSD